MKRINNNSSSLLKIILILTASLMAFSFGCAKKENKDIKIGVINSLTGSAAPYGENIQNGIMMAVDDINNTTADFLTAANRSKAPFSM